MKLKTLVLLLVTHVAALGIGFGGGIYTLPILVAPDAPTAEEVKSVATGAQFTAEFRRDLQDSDALHWGEGTVSIGPSAVSFMGRLAPGPDYKLYLSPEYLETEADFNRLKSTMVRIGDVKTFENFLVPLPADVDVEKFTSVIVWCEAFGEFITAAKYR